MSAGCAGGGPKRRSRIVLNVGIVCPIKIENISASIIMPSPTAQFV